MNWEKWSDEIGKHIKAIQDEAVEEYRQQLLKAVEEMRIGEHISGQQAVYGYNQALDEVIDLLKAKDYILE